MRTVGWTQYVENKKDTRVQDKRIQHPKIGGRVERLLATVAHVNFLMDMTNQWSLRIYDVQASDFQARDVQAMA